MFDDNALMQAIVDLRRQHALVCQLIRLHEELAVLMWDSTTPAVGGVRAPRKRGRKSMGAAERQVVSARMKAYWAGRQGVKGGRP